MPGVVGSREIEYDGEMPDVEPWERNDPSFVRKVWMPSCLPTLTLLKSFRPSSRTR